MPLRLIEMVLPTDLVHEVEELLQEHQIFAVWYDQLSEPQTLLKIIASVAETEAITDQLEKYYTALDGFRIILLPALTWWEVGIARRASRWAIAIWAILLTVLILIILLSQRL